MLPLADRVIVSLSMDIREDFYHSRGVHELFSMSKETVQTLLKIVADAGCEVLSPVIMEPGEHRRYEVTRDYPALFDLADEFAPFRKVMIETFCQMIENGETYLQA